MTADDTGMLVFEGDRFRVRRVTIHRPDGRTATKDVIDHPSAVAVLPLLDDGRVVMIRNHRFTSGRTLLEIPAGKVDEGETNEAAARRECQEETGYSVASLTPLCRFFPSPGILSEEMTVFVGRDLTAGRQQLQGNERIEVEIHAHGDLLKLIDSGGIEDAKTIIALLYYARRNAAGATA